MITGSCHCGAVTWAYDATPSQATACNCSVCRRYGVLWIYGWLGEDVTLTGDTTPYIREDQGDLEFRFCPACGAMAAWVQKAPDTDGRKRIAVNLRLADDPASVQGFPIRHFDGADTFKPRPDDGRTVGDTWF